jgi:hypothetical protein
MDVIILEELGKAGHVVIVGSDQWSTKFSFFGGIDLGRF